MTTSVEKGSLQRSSHQAPKTYLLFILGGGLLILGALAIFLLPDAPDVDLGIARAPTQMDFPAPDLALTDVSGNPVSLVDYRGKYVLLNNWATWCPPCKNEMPALERFYKDHKKDNFVLIGINAGDPADWVSEFAAEYRLTFPLWVDRKQDAVQEFRNYGLPSTYLIDTGGTVVMQWNGEINYATLDKYVSPLIEE